MAAEQLFFALREHGYQPDEKVESVLVGACESSEEAAQIVHWITQKLRSETLSDTRLDKEYEPSEEESAVASSFLASLNPSTQQSSAEEVDRTRRGTTLATLATARTNLEQDARKVGRDSAELSQPEEKGALAGAAPKASTSQAAEMSEREKQRVETRIAKSRKELEDQSTELKDMLTDIDSLTQQITELFTQESEGNNLMCLKELQEYRELDAKLMESLRTLHAEQHGYPLTEEVECEKHSTHPDIERLLFGESEKIVTERAVEIERMRLAYESGLERKVRMAALQAKQEKSLQALQGALTRPELSSQDITMLQAEADKQKASLDRLLTRKKQILSTELPQLCSSLASTHCWDAVKADFDVELQRNKYFITQKDLVLEILIDRAARNVALVTAAKDEAQVLTGVQDSLQAIGEDIKGLVAATRLRLEKLDALSMFPQPEPTPTSPSKMPPSQEVARREKLFTERLGEVVDAVIPSMQESSSICHALAFPTEAVESPVLTLDALASAFQKLEAVNLALLEANETVYKQQEGYNSVMRLQRDQVGLERSVFPTFFTHPEQLTKLALEARGKPEKPPPRTGQPKSTQPRTMLAKSTARKPRVSR